MHIVKIDKTFVQHIYDNINEILATGLVTAVLHIQYCRFVNTAVLNISFNKIMW